MPPSIAFLKMTGSGNDFIMVDNRTGRVAEQDMAAFARAFCPRRTSVGADGAIFVAPSDAPETDFRMRYFNADGSEAEMCGNGARCVARFAHEIGAAGPEMRFATGAGPIRGWIRDHGARVELTPPTPIVEHTLDDVPDALRKVFFLNTGVPHVVVFVDDIEAVDVRGWGHLLRFHPAFAPAGANANFVSDTGNGYLRVRTYERGVEDETLACGTGATACALVAVQVHRYAQPVRLRVQSGEELLVAFDGAPPAFAPVYLEGPARVVYRGELTWQGAGAAPDLLQHAR
jgi:diaminopimelate epimerase